jgi:hypothetical protein
MGYEGRSRQRRAPLLRREGLALLAIQQGDGSTARVSSSKIRYLDVPAMVRASPPPVPWLAPGVIPRGALTVMYAPGGEMKSLLSLGIAGAVARGEELAGIECAKGTALYFDAENGRAEIHRRVHALGLPEDGIEVAEVGGLDIRKDFAEVEGEVLDKKPELLVLDSLRSLTPGMDENDTSTTAAALDPIRRLAHNTGTAVLLIHHANKGGKDFRGASSIRDAVDVLWHLGRAEDDPDPARRFLHNKKMRVARDGAKLWLALDVDQGRILLEPAGPPEKPDIAAASPTRARLSEEILAGLSPAGMSLGAVAELVGRKPKDGSVRNALAGLLDAGEVERDGNLYKPVHGAKVQTPLGSVAPLHQPDADEELARVQAKFGEAAA